MLQEALRTAAAWVALGSDWLGAAAVAVQKAACDGWSMFKEAGGMRGLLVVC